MTSNEATSPESEAARDAYFGMLKRELALKGMLGAYRAVVEHLRITPSKEETTSTGTTKVTMEIHHLVTNYNRRKDGSTAECISWYVDFLAEDDSRSMAATDARALAESVANPPNDAQIVAEGYESQGGRTYYRVRWQHVVDGLIVEGDYIDVMVNSKAARVFSYAKVWRTPHLSNEFIER